MTERELQLLERIKSAPAFRDSLAQELGIIPKRQDSTNVLGRFEAMGSDATAFEDDLKRQERAQFIRESVDRYGGAPIIRSILGKPSEAQGAFDVGRQSFAESLTGIPFTAGVPVEELAAHPVAS